MILKTAWSVVKASFLDFIDDDVMTLGAALAFYTVLSMAPLLVLIVSAAGLLGVEAEGRLSREIQDLVGGQSGDTVRTIVAYARQHPRAGVWSAVAGTAMLLIAASGVFAALQQSMNRIWHVRPRSDKAFWAFARKRLLSMGVILLIGVLLLASLAGTALVAALLPRGGLFWWVVNEATALGAFWVLFSLMFKYLPDVRTPWREVIIGALVAAVLFAIGKFGFTLYMRFSSFGSAYGAAGSLVILLLWIYYASLMVFFGVEVAQAMARVAGRKVEPEAHAEWLPWHDEHPHPEPRGRGQGGASGGGDADEANGD